VSEPVVTVVVPYHAARKRNGMLQRAINSVNAQTTPHLLVTVEDTTGQGAAKTRQRGLDQVTTPWVAFLDSDDEMDPTHLQQLLAYAEQTEADYVYPWFRVVGGRDPFPMFFGKPWDDAHPHSTTITILVRTELAKRVGFTGEGEDFRFTKGCIAAGAKIVHYPAKTWTWVHGPQNTSGRPNRGDARRR
jgi:glycosyltransferase involved in cell wall biosynthesis